VTGRGEMDTHRHDSNINIDSFPNMGHLMIIEDSAVAEAYNSNEKDSIRVQPIMSSRNQSTGIEKTKNTNGKSGQKEF